MSAAYAYLILMSATLLLASVNSWTRGCTYSTGNGGISISEHQTQANVRPLRPVQFMRLTRRYNRTNLDLANLALRRRSRTMHNTMTQITMTADAVTVAVMSVELSDTDSPTLVVNTWRSVVNVIVTTSVACIKQEVSTSDNSGTLRPNINPGFILVLRVWRVRK